TGWFRFSTQNPGSCNDAFGTRSPANGGSSLGSGGSPVSYAQTLSNLAPGTTYYFCAIAENAVGKGFGSVLSFTTLAAPSVTTVAATSVTSTGATLNGSANPKLADATGWFRYGTANPGTCNDSFGTRAPVSGGTSLGAGSSAVAYAETLAGLTPGTTYYFCAIAENAVGTGFGAVMSFTTPGAPSVTTEAATMVLSTAAILNASADPNLAAATGWFRYDTADPGTCDDTFGTRAPAASGVSLGAGSNPVAYSEPLAGLMPLTTYYFCAVAENAVGKSFGAVLSFTTSGAPMVVTKDATDLTSSTATLNGSADPNLSATTAWFRYDTVDPGTCDDAFGTRAPANGGTNVGAGSSPVDYAEAVTGLLPGTTYYFCAIASNQGGGTSFGEVLSMTTEAEAPSVTTSPPTTVEADSAMLNGSANPNGDAATGWFRYDTIDPGACDDSFGVRAPAAGGSALGDGVEAVAFSEALSGLTPGMTYYYCAIASNSEGTSFGEVLSFVTGAAPPTVTTEEATEVAGTGATIAGTAVPNGSIATGWFRYGDVDPGACDDAFGTRAPEMGGFTLGAGSGPVSFEQPLTGLEPNRTYYYCAAVSNMAGATFGEVLSFTTEAVPPVVETTPPEVTGQGAVTLNGAANPMGSESIAWFRFDTVDPGACNDTFGTRAPSADGESLGDGRKEVPFSEAVGGLAPGTYYACAIGSNDAGLGFGEVVTFEIPREATPPTPTDPEGGCGCRVGSGRSGSMVSVVSLVALFLLTVRRRRRRAA
ncbi:MAG TPA: MYXO-CTERM sorting domain-containing protein, partial [Polyangiaceae bacterium]|nr:MYXO-CTERM sorting domain-containing protein [Polyangiaceae bacterium]